MADRVILHVGPPKTATTYLQDVLWSNVAQLHAVGVELPLGSRRRQWHAAASLCGDRWAHLRDAATATWEHFARAAGAATGTALLSDEGLALATPDDAARAVASLAPAPVHVVVTAREPTRMLASAWQQEVKTRDTRTLERFVRDLMADTPTDADLALRRRHDPAHVLGVWAAHVPTERRHLVTCPASATDRDEMWRRFATVLGVEIDRGCDRAAGGHNPSFGAGQIEMLRRMNETLGERLPMQDPYVRAVRHGVVAAMTDTGVGNGRVGLDPAWRTTLEGFADDTVATLRSLGVEPIGDWDDLRPSALLGTETASDADIARAGIDTLAALAVRFNAAVLRSDDGVVAAGERDALRVERDALQVERDGLRVERNALRDERDAFAADRDVARAELATTRAELAARAAWADGVLRGARRLREGIGRRPASPR